MLREERWQKLEAFIREREFVSYADMLREFGISKSTAYRDLQTVCKQHPGIVFTRGGVMNIKGNVGSEATLSQRSTQFTAEKQRIAKEASEMIHRKDTIYLDSGSTTTILARIFPDQPQIIYTSGLSCAMELARLEQANIYLPAGRMNRYSMSVCGSEGVRTLERINFDLVFMGVTSFSEETGFSCGVEEEANLKRAAMLHAGTKVMLMDSSKAGKTSAFRFANPEDVDIVISDGELPDSVLEFCNWHGIQVL